MWLEADAQQRTGVAGQLLPGRGEDIAGDDAPQDLARRGHQKARDLVGHGPLRRGIGRPRCPVLVTGGGSGSGSARRGRTAGRICAGVEAGDEALEVGVIGSEVLHVIQHTVLPQVAGHIVQDEAVDLASLIDGVVADVRTAQCDPR